LTVFISNLLQKGDREWEEKDAIHVLVIRTEIKLHELEQNTYCSGRYSTQMQN